MRFTVATKQKNKPRKGSNNTSTSKKLWWYEQPAPIDRFTGWLVLWTALLFAANLAALFFIGQQWKVSSDAQTDTRQQLRAVVTLQGVNEQTAADKDGKISYYAFSPILQNTGGTRTARFSSWDSIKYFEGAVPNNIDFSKPFISIDIVQSVIAGGGIVQQQPITITAADGENITQNKGVGLLWGHAEYADIFSPTVAHNIWYCYKLVSVTTTDGKTVFQTAPYKNDCNSSD